MMILFSLILFSFDLFDDSKGPIKVSDGDGVHRKLKATFTFNENGIEFNIEKQEGNLMFSKEEKGTVKLTSSGVSASYDSKYKDGDTSFGTSFKANENRLSGKKSMSAEIGFKKGLLDIGVGYGEMIDQNQKMVRKGEVKGSYGNDQSNIEGFFGVDSENGKYGGLSMNNNDYYETRENL